MKKLVALLVSIILIISFVSQSLASTTIHVKSICLNKNGITLKVGQVYNFQVSFMPKNTTERIVVFSSSDKKIVTVDKNGKITAVKSGTAVIKVVASKHNNISSTCRVTVISPTLDNNPPVYIGASLNSTNKTIVLSYDKPLSKNKLSNSYIKKSIKYSNKYTSTYQDLGPKDTVQILDNKIIINLEEPITNCKYIFKISKSIIFSINNIQADCDTKTEYLVPSSKRDKFLIIVSNPLYKTGLLNKPINTYQTDLSKEGWETKLIKVNNIQDTSANYICATPEELKKIIRKYYNEGYDGFVLIGSAPSIPNAKTYYYLRDDNGNITSDHFYADMDGDWSDRDDDRNSTLEMFCGRISPGPLVNFEITGEAKKVAEYLNRIHNFRINGGNLTKEEQNRGLVFEDGTDDGAAYRRYLNDISSSLNLYYIKNINVSSPSKYIEELQKGYKYIHLTSHSYATSHSFSSYNSNGEKMITTDILSIDQLMTVKPKFNYMLMDACSACKFDKPNLGAVYMYNNDYACNIIGMTNVNYSGSFAGEEFQDSIFKFGIPIGIAFESINLNNGFILLGDPTITYSKKTDPQEIKCPYMIYPLIELDATVNMEFRHYFGIGDYYNKIVTAEIKNLPEGAVFDGNSIIWTPSIDQAGKIFYLSIKLTNSYGSTFQEDFSIYVSYFDNGNLREINKDASIEDIWTKEGDISLQSYERSAFYNSILSYYGLEADNSWGYIKQSINIKENVNYILKFKVSNELMANADKAYVSIDELGVKIPIPKDTHGFLYTGAIFNSGDNENLTISLHIGDNKNLCSGKLIATAFRLTPKG